MWFKSISFPCIIIFIITELCSPPLIYGYGIRENLKDNPKLERVVATISANKENFRKGEMVVVTCKCEGSLHNTVDWKYMSLNGKFKNVYKAITNYTVQQISDTETDFEVCFKILESSKIICACKGHNDYNSSFVSVYVTELNDPVEIFAPIHQPADREVFEMTCAADSANFSNVDWYKNDFLQDTDIMKTVYSKSSNNSVMKVLKFDWITMKDSGTYECRANEKPSFFSDSDEVKTQSVFKHIEVQERYLRLHIADEDVILEDENPTNEIKLDITTIYVVISGFLFILLLVSVIVYGMNIKRRNRNQDKIYEMQVLKDNERSPSYGEQEPTDSQYRSLISPTPDIIQMHQNPISRNKSEETMLIANFIASQKPTTVERFPVIPEQPALEMPRSRTGIYETDKEYTSLPFVRLSQLLDEAVEMGNQEEATEQEAPTEPYIPIRKVVLPRSLSYIRRSAEILKKRVRSFHLLGEVLNEFMQICQEYEFPETNLKFTKNLGDGAFGIVRHAFAYGLVPDEEKTDVAVKSIKDNHKHGKDALLSEIKIMVHIGQHVNVVNLLGIVTQNISKGEFMIMVEYCSRGNVREFLKNNRHKFVDEINPETDCVDSASHHITLREQRTLTTSHLLSWSFQVARGMDFLSSKRVIHGDLAARNILLCQDNFVKICDFGLARFKQESNYYRKRTSGLIPVKWIALESFNANIFSTYSDVWSFGIVLWELFSLGEEPYPEIGLSDVYTKLVEGYRMQKPKYSTENLYHIMMRCWMKNTKDRPSFTELESILGEMLNLRIRDYVVSSNEPYLIMNREVEKYQQNINYTELMYDVSQNYQNL